MRRLMLSSGMAKSAGSVEKIQASSGSVFADLGLPDALNAKMRLAVAPMAGSNLAG